MFLYAYPTVQEQGMMRRWNRLIRCTARTSNQPASRSGKDTLAIRGTDYTRGGIIRSINPYSIASLADM